ncbi:MAG: electron transfer flavoprotein subunit alpha/FixB family protein [Steroidobacteraceae bacterium]|nr:electron transfer flavoprotein subunit alpha/FixB family protein [Steroidobacteraceae bacterium]MBP7012621.1 electron transfer flavoprotein subunit alpha/FixB family protein [Steroidobacteraceae bacterium]
MSVVVCSWGSVVERGTEEVLTAARAYCVAAGLPLRWAVAGTDRETALALASRYGVAAVDVIEHPKLGSPGPDVLVEALSQYLAATQPALVLCNQSAAARLVAPRLAGRLGAAVVTNVFALGHEAGALHVSATAYGGDVHAVYRMPSPTNVVCLVTTTLVAEPAVSASPPVCNQVDVNLDAVAERFNVTSAPKAEGPRLEDAEVVVTGGRGLGKADNLSLVKDLAAVLGGMWGGSRPIVDDGWIDSSRQVGLTGKITRPRLYVAVGVSGASQHMAGCSAAKTIVAINKDPDAAIFKYARYGIVGDALEVMPELIKAARGG